MYGVFYIAILSAVIFIVALLIGIIATLKQENWEAIRCELSYEEEKSNNVSRKIVVYYKINTISVWITIIFVFIFIVSIISGIAGSVSAKQEYLEFIEIKKSIELVYQSGNEYDNITISTKIIEANAWLAQAKADKQTLGCMSKYCALNLESLEYITLKGE